MPTLRVTIDIRVPDETNFRATLAGSPWGDRVKLVEALPAVVSALVTETLDDMFSNDLDSAAWPSDATATTEED